VVLPATPGDLVAMSDADLRLVCAQAGIDGAGAMVDVQSRLHVHLFGAPGTPTEAVQTACDVEFAAVLLSATGSSDDVAEHSAAGAWLASSLRYLLRKQVTVKTFLHRKVTFQRAGQAHNDVVFAQDMKPGDPGLVQFVEAWVTQLIAVMPLPALMTIEDAEGSLVDVLKALCTAKVNPAGAPPPPAPVDWLVEFQRAAAAGKPVDDSAFNNADLSKAIAALRSYGFFVDKSGVPRLSQLILIMKAMSAKEAGRSTPGLCVDPRVQPLSLRAMLDANGNFAPDQAKMVQLADGTWVESSTPEPVSTKVHTALEVVSAHSMYWTAHLVVGTRLTDLHSRYDGLTSAGVWNDPWMFAVSTKAPPNWYDTTYASVFTSMRLLRPCKASMRLASAFPSPTVFCSGSSGITVSAGTSQIRHSRVPLSAKSSSLERPASQNTLDTPAGLVFTSKMPSAFHTHWYASSGSCSTMSTFSKLANRPCLSVASFKRFTSSPAYRILCKFGNTASHRASCGSRQGT